MPWGADVFGEIGGVRQGVGAAMTGFIVIKAKGGEVFEERGTGQGLCARDGDRIGAKVEVSEVRWARWGEPKRTAQALAERCLVTSWEMKSVRARGKAW